MDWSDVLKLALSIFLVVTGLGLGYLFLRIAGVFSRVGSSVTRVTDEIVPILSRAQTTVDGVNLELQRVDEMMQTAVNATKGAEKTVQTVSSAVTAPVRKLTGLAAGLKETVANLRAQRRRDAADAAAARAAAEARSTAAAPPIVADNAPPAAAGGSDPASVKPLKSHESPY
ncbi:MAG: DUF948 domain-containing protein [Miltoncostaeaceae bacterium]